MIKSNKKETNNIKGAGRKPAEDPRDKFVLFIERSKFCGVGNEKMSPDSDEYKRLYANFKAQLYLIPLGVV